MRRSGLRRPRAMVQLLLLASFACTATSDSPEAGRLRAAGAGVALPDDAAGLADLLGVPAESLFAAGNARYQAGSYDSARAIWRVELKRAGRAADSAGVAHVLMWLGLADWHIGDFAKARQQGEAAVALKRRLGLDAQLSQSFNALGLLAWHEGRLADALALFDSAAASARRNDDARGLTRTRMNRPLVQLDLGQYAEAREGFRSALVAARATGDSRYEGNALANLAMLEIRTGEATAAIPLLAEARARYAAGDDGYLAGETNALGQLATAWSQLGDLQRAIAAADSALALARAQGLAQEVAASLEVLADLELQAGSAGVALRRIRQADSIDAALGLAAERGVNLRRSSVILLRMGEARAAVLPAEKSLAIHRELAARTDIVRDRLQLALALAETGDLRGGARESDAAVREAHDLGVGPLRREAAVVAADLALRNGDPRRALEYVSGAGLTGGVSDWMLPHVAAGALLALGRLDEARTQAERSVATLERERSMLALGPLRSAYLADRAAPFARLVQIHLARGDTVSAFEAAAALPGRALADRLGELVDSAGPMAAAAEDEGLLRSAAAIEREIAAADQPEDAERRAALRRALEAAHATYEDRLSRGDRLPAERILGLGRVRLADVERSLAPQEALVAYLAGPERLDIFLVTGTTLAHRSVRIGARELAARVRVARQVVIGAGPARAVPPALGDLHEVLVAPFADVVAPGEMNRLLIVPHGPLAALPFAALWDRRAAMFLAQRLTLSYLPAVSALGSGAARPADARRAMVFAPLPDLLPGTAAETRQVVRLLPGATAVTGRAATEVRVRRALVEGRTVHVASHGALNLQNPLFTRITVGRASGPGSATDGQLEVHEILRMRIPSRLVFLSGCETGLSLAGQEPFGRQIEEGGLAQAFLAAGAQAVVATLWPVEDVAAAQMAREFYRDPAAEASPAEALAGAQRRLIGAGRGLGWAAYGVWETGGRKPRATVRTTGSEL